MKDLPAGVTAALVAGVGAYIRAAELRAIPPGLRRLRGFRPGTLRRYAPAIIEALYDEDFRARIGTWLRADKPSLDRDVRRVLEAAIEPGDWATGLAGLEVSRAPDPRPIAADDGSQLERERAKVKRARAAERKAKEQARGAVAEAESRIRALESEIAAMRAGLRAAEDNAGRAADEVRTVREESERELRKATRGAEAARTAAREASAKERRARGNVARLERDLERAAAEVRRLEGRLAAESARAAHLEANAPPDPARPQKRKALAVPRGRFAEDPQVLEEWLSTDGVKLLVDGYNVTMTRAGYKAVSLEQQRGRLADAVASLARRKAIQAIVVFDGKKVDAPSERRFHGTVKIEYSRPGEIADDHLVALLEEMPPVPVVVATNDRELQERVAARGATVATADQLLALSR